VGQVLLKVARSALFTHNIRWQQFIRCNFRIIFWCFTNALRSLDHFFQEWRGDLQACVNGFHNWELWNGDISIISVFSSPRKFLKLPTRHPDMHLVPVCYHQTWWLLSCLAGRLEAFSSHHTLSASIQLGTVRGSRFYWMKPTPFHRLVFSSPCRLVSIGRKRMLQDPALASEFYEPGFCFCWLKISPVGPVSTLMGCSCVIEQTFFLEMVWKTRSRSSAESAAVRETMM